MKNLFLLLSVLILNSTINQLYSQSIKQYSGEYSNGTGTPGKATYSYYLEDDARIKQGKFSYSQNVKGIYGSYNCAISGSYKDNYKNGTWVYTITYKDYNTGMGNIFATGNIKLTSGYINGYPNGNWSYIEKNKVRSKTLISWTAYDPTTTTTVSANFKNGVLVGNFKMKGDINNDDVSGTMDEKGYCINEWIFISGRSDINELKYQFYKNILIKYVAIKLSTGEVIKKSDFSENEITLLKNYADGLISCNDLKNNRIKIDTNEFDISLNSTLYNSNFLTDYITGDKSCYAYKFQGEGFHMINTKRIILKKLTEIHTYNLPDYNKAVETMNNPKSTSHWLERALEGLNYILKNYEKFLSKDDIQTLKANIIECENKMDSVKKQEIEKENEYKAINEFDHSKSNIETLENYLIRAKRYNEMYSVSSFKSKISRIEASLKMKKEEQRKKEFNEIIIFVPKKKDKETLLNALKQINTFKEKYELTEGEKFFFETQVPLIEKALKKCK